jgi:butyrate kinase
MSNFATSQPGIIVINPGSTSTKIAYFEGETQFFVHNLVHTAEELSPYKNVADQYQFRKDVIINELKKSGVDFTNVKAVIGRGGMVRPIASGTYRINEKLKTDLRQGYLGEHASNLGGLIADDLASGIPGAQSFIADPVVVDELCPPARVIGHPLFKRISVFHALNQKAVARRYAREHNVKYESVNLIVAHMGGGISVGAHQQGKVIDVNNALDGDGPLSPERCGSVPSGQLIKLCFSKKYTEEEIRKMINGRGGLTAYLGTNDVREISRRAENGDEQAALLFETMCYQVGKWTGAMAAILHGKVDAIILTGGIAHNEKVTNYIKEMCGFIAPVIVYPGEDEMRALALNALAVLNGEMEAKDYLAE